MERKPVRAQNPRINPTLGVSVAAPFASLLPIGTKDRATTPTARTLATKLLLLQRAPSPHRRVLSHPTRTTTCAVSVSTRSLRHPQAFTRKTWRLSGQAPASMLAANQIVNHYTSGVACSVYNRNRRRLIDSTRPHPWYSRPGMNDLGTWAEL